MTDYSVRFERGNRAWTCSVFQLGADEKSVGAAVATGTGQSRNEARDAALALATDPEIRAALAGSDQSRPYWTQGALGEKREAERKSAAVPGVGKKRTSQ